MARQRVLRDLDQARPLIRKREPFRAPIRFTRYGTFCSLSGGSLSGWEWELRSSKHSIGELGDLATLGALPREYHESAYQAEYVVRSFWTPIAWWVPRPASMDNPAVVEGWLDDELSVGHWIMPQVKYSITTTNHQDDVLGAIKNHGGSWRPNWSPDGEVQPLRVLAIAGAPEKVPCSVERW